MDSIVAVGAIIGVGNAIKTQFPQAVGLIGVGISLVLGVVLGYFNLLGVSGVENGLLAGLSASGVYTIAKRIGGQ